ncbi:Ubiquitin [Operophtera brumata]|uniref:Ubiquitin n=1 Tax=Operophtera brumata TaxID=104452 RepID=A0A0L7L2H6_OPEBR|nr:Ubiquitin [Operophtera brumata]
MESGRKLSDYNIQEDSTKHLMLGLQGGEVQRLIYGAKEMESGRKLSDYNIQEDSAIHLMLGLQEGRVGT